MQVSVFTGAAGQAGGKNVAPTARGETWVAGASSIPMDRALFLKVFLNIHVFVNFADRFFVFSVIQNI